MLEHSMDYYKKSIVYLELGIKGGRYLKKTL